MPNRDYMPDNKVTDATRLGRPQEGDKTSRHNQKLYNTNEAHQAAVNKSGKETSSHKEHRSQQAQRHSATHITRDNRDDSFDQTMDEIRKRLPRSARPFSRFIHAPSIERISDVLSRTIARPDAILAGGVTAFITILGLYFYAKYAGFALRGSETIIAFAIGWVLGILSDCIKAIFTRTK